MHSELQDYHLRLIFCSLNTLIYQVILRLDKGLVVESLRAESLRFTILFKEKQINNSTQHKGIISPIKVFGFA